MIQKLVCFLLIISVLGCNKPKDMPIDLELGKDWKFKNIQDSIWLKARVPGTVHTDLLSNQLINDPFVGNNEADLQWISETNWNYITEFKVEPELLKSQFMELNFEGLDTYTSVFLNDQLILKSNNAFRSYKIDVKEYIREQNTLEIRFESTKTFENKAAAVLSYTLTEGNRIFTRKPQFQYGWDWGPKFNTFGIWRPITLKTWNHLAIDHMYVNQIDLNDKRASLELQIDQSTEIQDSLKYNVYINNKFYKSFDKIPENGTTILPVEILKPKLWWPHNIGKPYQYVFRVEIFKDQTLLEQIEKKRGLRTVELITKKDSIGSSFYFEVNGVPVYAKGANYIPQNSFQTEVTNEHYEKLLNDAVAANMNMLRVWGGGIYENDIFYELANEKGIMIWQDFMFACAMYPGDKAFLENVEQEAIQNVKRLQNHACVVLWCGNNESAEGWRRWGWQSGRSVKEKNKIWNDYLSVFDSILPKIVKTHTNAPYWESSPSFGRGNPNYLTQGDAHDWWVWHDGYPFEHFESNVPRFMSEFGFQAFPSYKTIQFINPNDSVSLDTPAFKNHQKHQRGFQIIDQYLERDYVKPYNAKDYIYLSQILQARGITMGIEAQRRAKPYCMGSLYWQLNDCWPAISWSSIDFFGNWKALHYTAKEVFDNILISAKVNSNDVDIYLVNDYLSNQKGTLELKLIDFKGEVLFSASEQVSIAANSSMPVYKLKLDNIHFNPNNSVLVAHFKNHSKNIYFVKPNEMSLTPAKIDSRVVKTSRGFTLMLKSNDLQKSVFLTVDNEGQFSNNFFDLLPNETHEIFFESKDEKLKNLEIISLNFIIQDIDYEMD